MKMARTAKLFLNGRSQAVRLPAEFRFDGSEVFIRRDPSTGDVILSRRPDLLALLKGREFTSEGWRARINASLAALDAPQPTELSVTQWKVILACNIS